jgi:hypothetical protein
MTTPQCRPVWRTVVLGATLFSGYVYGLNKQQGLYKRAKAKVEEEEKLIALYKEEYRQDLLKKEAEARGEDVSVFNVPPGLRQIAKTIKSTRSKNTAGTEEETKKKEEGKSA